MAMIQKSLGSKVSSLFFKFHRPPADLPRRVLDDGGLPDDAKVVPFALRQMKAFRCLPYLRGKRADDFVIDCH